MQQGARRGPPASPMAMTYLLLRSQPRTTAPRANLANLAKAILFSSSVLAQPRAIVRAAELINDCADHWLCWHCWHPAPQGWGYAGYNLKGILEQEPTAWGLKLFSRVAACRTMQPQRCPSRPVEGGTVQVAHLITPQSTWRVFGCGRLSLTTLYC